LMFFRHSKYLLGLRLPGRSFREQLLTFIAANMEIQLMP
jgi:hypothetical protein